MQPLEIFVVVVAGIFGLLIGSFLNVVAYRVPARVSLLRESRCSHCNAALKPWQNIPVLSWLVLRGRCASCNEAISVRYPVVEAITGLAFAAVAAAWLLAASPFERATASAAGAVLVLLAYLYFAAVSIVLTLIDLDTARLPNSIVLPSYLVGIVLLSCGSLLTADWTALLRAAIGMGVLYLGYFVLRLIRPNAMGGGDVKLAGVVGLYLGYIGWGALAVGAFAAFLFGGVYGVALLILGRAGRKSSIPFGPWMIVGAWVGIFTGEAVGRWYTSLYMPS
jgi:leader peptidase (prepilin peptidase)/N-methyltransferase